MCEILNVPRSTFYYKNKPETVDSKLENAVIEEFGKSRNNYGTRKLKVELNRSGFIVSRRRIGRIMRKYGLVSKYTLRQTKKHKSDTVNEDGIANVLNREFDDRPKFDVVVSDLTYIKIAGKWHYLCLILDLCGLSCMTCEKF
jgi:transposase InsO family protein